MVQKVFCKRSRLEVHAHASLGINSAIIQRWNLGFYSPAFLFCQSLCLLSLVLSVGA